jgi:hypothetical protein
MTDAFIEEAMYAEWRKACGCDADVDCKICFRNVNNPVWNNPVSQASLIRDGEKTRNVCLNMRVPL